MLEEQSIISPYFIFARVITAHANVKILFQICKHFMNSLRLKLYIYQNMNL